MTNNNTKNSVSNALLQHKPLSQLTLPNDQRGASVGGVVFVVLTLGILLKLAVAIVPAQVGDYQLDKNIANQLKKSNEKQETSKQFLESLSRRLSSNADYDTKPEEILTFTNEKRGNLEVYKKYEVANKFFGNVDIVNRFEGKITAAESTE